MLKTTSDYSHVFYRAHPLSAKIPTVLQNRLVMNNHASFRYPLLRLDVYMYIWFSVELLVSCSPPSLSVCRVPLISYDRLCSTPNATRIFALLKSKASGQPSVLRPAGRPIWVLALHQCWPGPLQPYIQRLILFPSVNLDPIIQNTMYISDYTTEMGQAAQLRLTVMLDFRNREQ